MPTPPLDVFNIVPAFPTAYPTFADAIYIPVKNVVFVLGWFCQFVPPLVVLLITPVGPQPYTVVELTKERLG